MRSTCFEPGAQPAQVSTTRTKTHFWGELQTENQMSECRRESWEAKLAFDEFETLRSILPPLERNRADHRLVLCAPVNTELRANNRIAKHTVGVQVVVDQQLGFSRS